MFEKEVVALTCASILTPFKSAESLSGLQRQQAIDADGQEMFGSTLLDKYRVQERGMPKAVRKSGNLALSFLFLALSAALLSVNLMCKYRRDKSNGERRAGETKERSLTNGEPSVSLTRVMEARRSLLLNHCIRKARSQNVSTTRDCETGGADEECRRQKEKIFPPLRHLNYIQNLPGDLVFCIPLKAGSSSLNQFMVKNVDSGDFQTWYNETKKSTDNKLVEELVERGGTSRVMVIRHPWHRLVSAFHYIFRASVNLKPIFVEQAATSWLASRIIRKLRPQSNDPLVSFPEFVDYVLNTDGKFTDLKAEEVARWSWGYNPVGISDHFQPFSTFCSPCRLLPQMILELETLSETLPFVLEWSGLSRVYGQFSALPRVNEASVANTKEVTKELMGQLTSSQVEGLLEYYKDDFDIGGYKVHLNNSHPSTVLSKTDVLL